MSADFVAQLAALREQYAQKLRTTLDDLVARVSSQNTEVSHRIVLAEVHASLHKLAGSGGTFGFPELSQQARILEVTAKGWLDDTNVPELKQWEAWNKCSEPYRSEFPFNWTKAWKIEEIQIQD